MDLGGADRRPDDDRRRSRRRRYNTGIGSSSALPDRRLVRRPHPPRSTGHPLGRSLRSRQSAAGVPEGWRRTAALERALVVAAGLLILAIVLRRPDLVVLAAPFALGTAAAL